MSDTDTVLLEPSWAKHGDKWFRTAYKWTRDEIFKWMAEMAASGSDQEAKDLLARIRSRLIDLSLPAGSLFKDRKRRPDSHISRNVNLDWKIEDATSSKFNVNPMFFRQITKTFNGPAPDWWCPYDLLGLFLGLLGPAPAAADKYNFYLPLTGVYGRWCARIAGKPERGWGKWTGVKGEGTLPYVFQCTWTLEVDDSTKQHRAKYFLGASTAGDRWENKIINPSNKSPTYTGAWRDRVGEERFKMLYRCQRPVMVRESDYRDRNAPSQTDANGSMFVIALLKFLSIANHPTPGYRDTTQNLKYMSGLALQKNFMRGGEWAEYEAAPNTPIWANLMAPCPNCTMLIAMAGATRSKFDIEQGQGTPPKP
ncbi:hypothetical protein FPANT_5138 [Fusarium pseudoanthophilum]|uniref:Uncharacterized protein n=1 Tax=Fusarium pseudoanthophilum TaxID=48495 RepID=A0A8H5PB37_9HYPO|nr:hypothetical protein FPANT_5138 [Fusarium pseudoanthophilum]